MESLIFLTEKRDGRVKARACANGSTQRSYIPKDDASSPTAATESILITGVIEAKQKRDVMALDIPNAFVQTEVPQGSLVDMLIDICPGKYEEFEGTIWNAKSIHFVLQEVQNGHREYRVLSEPVRCLCCQ